MEGFCNSRGFARKRRLVAALLAVTVLTPAARGQDTGNQVGPGAAGGSPPIIVTARKRTELLQDAPLAITALSGDDLINRGADDFVDFARSIPGLSFTDLGAGRQKVALRGINVTIGEATVGYYLGETPIPATLGTLRLSNPDPKLVDIERVEVLRGPQGTLYGTGSIGGTIRLLPHQPNYTDFEGSVSAEATFTHGGGAGGELQGVINIPIVQDRLALRTAAWFTEADGFIDRIVGMPDADGEVRTGQVVASNIPYERTRGFRSILGIAVTDDITVDLMAYRQHQHFSGFQDITGGLGNPQDRLVQRFLADVPEPSENNFWLFNGLLNVDLGNAEIVSSTSYYRGSQAATEEGTAIINAFFGTIFGNSLTETNRSRSVSHETRVSAVDIIDGIDAIVGVFYSREHQDRSSQWVPPGIGDALATGTDVLFSRFATTTNRDWAVFGELTWNLTDDLSITGGVRHFDGRYRQDSQTAGLFYDPSAPETYDSPPTLSSDDSGEVYKANISYDLTEDHLVYATYSEGFRGGFGIGAVPSTCAADLQARGFATTPTQVRPDRLSNYEVGAKTTWLDGALTLNAAAYQIDWTDIQQSIFLPCGFSLVVNSGRARSRGLETELAIQVSPAFEIGGTLSYTRARTLQADTATGALANDQLIDVPRWQGAAYLQYNQPVSDDLEFEFRTDLQYTGPSYAGYQRLASGMRDPLFRKEELTLINLRAGLNAEQWSLTAFVENLFNDVERQAYSESLVLTVPTRPRYVVNRPRTFGITGRISF